MTPLGNRVRKAAAAEGAAMEAELRRRRGDAAVDTLRRVLAAFVQRNGGGEELAANRSRASLTRP